MDKKTFEISHSGFDTFYKNIEGGKSTVYLDGFGNTDLLVTQLENGKITIIPKSSDSKIEIFDDQIIITRK